MRQLMTLLFLSLLVGIFIGANIYLVKRFNWFFSIEHTKMLYALFIPLSLLVFFGVMPLSNSTNLPGSLIYKISAITMGVLLYLLISTLLFDIVRIFTNFPPKTYGFSILILTVLVSLVGILNAWNPRLTQHEIAINGLKNEVRAVHLSDIHIGHFRGKRFLQKIVDKTNQKNVDVVFITGDLFDGKINLNKKTLMPLTELKAPVYFVEGNHDRYSGIRIIKKYLRDLNINVLENEIADVQGIQVIGLNHMRADSETFDVHAAGNHSTIKSTLEMLPIDQSKPTILLHHSPDGIKYAHQHGVDLYLAGHTHGGQLFPINYIARLLFAYNKGLHDYLGTKIYVSQGTGTFGPPMRLGTKSEIALFTIKPM